jgi:hypothetical protein
MDDPGDLGPHGQLGKADGSDRHGSPFTQHIMVT